MILNIMVYKTKVENMQTKVKKHANKKGIINRTTTQGDVTRPIIPKY